MHKSVARTGAPVTVQLRVGDRPILSLGDSLDILFAWSQDAYDRYRDTLWSEDMHGGLVIDGRLRVVDPFRGVG